MSEFMSMEGLMMLDLLPDLCDEYGDALQVAEPLFQNLVARRCFTARRSLSCYEDNSLVRSWSTGPAGAGDGDRWRWLLRRALLGDQLAIKAAEQGWEGIVIYGAVRDVGTLATLALGSRHWRPVRSKPRSGDKGAGCRGVVCRGDHTSG